MAREGIDPQRRRLFVLLHLVDLLRDEPVRFAVDGVRRSLLGASTRQKTLPASRSCQYLR